MTPIDLDAVSAAAISWLLTYAIHSTILLGAALAIAARFADEHGWLDLVWKTALLGPIVTASVQLNADVRPIGGRWPITTPMVAAAPQPSTARTSARTEVRASGRHESVLSDGARRTEVRAYVRRSRAHQRRTEGGTSVPPCDPCVGRLLRGRHVAGDRRRRPDPLRPAVPAPPSIAPVGSARVGSASAPDDGDVEPRRRGPCSIRLTTSDDLCRSAGAGGPAGRVARAVPGAARRRPAARSAGPRGGARRRGTIPHGACWLARSSASSFSSPSTAIARTRLCESAEFLCDQWAVQQTRSALALARCLSAVAAWASPEQDQVWAGASPMARSDSPLIRRVTRILTDVPPNGRRPSAVWLAAALVAVALAAPLVTAAQIGDPASIGCGSTIADNRQPRRRRLTANRRTRICPHVCGRRPRRPRPARASAS